MECRECFLLANSIQFYNFAKLSNVWTEFVVKLVFFPVLVIKHFSLAVIICPLDKWQRLWFCDFRELSSLHFILSLSHTRYTVTNARNATSSIYWVSNTRLKVNATTKYLVIQPLHYHPRICENIVVRSMGLENRVKYFSHKWEQPGGWRSGNRTGRGSFNR